MSMLFKILQTTFYAVFIAGILAVAGLFLASVLPIPGQIEIKIVQSGSMEPAIKTGGIVVIQPQASYSIGDVVTFGKDTKTDVPTTHRIMEERSEGSVTYFTTKGDANEEIDANEVLAHDVIGKVLFTVPYAGYILDFAKQPLGFTFMIGIPAALIVLYEVLGIFSEVKRLGKKNKDTDDDVGGTREEPRLSKKETPKLAGRGGIPLTLEDPVLDLRREYTNLLDLRGGDLEERSV